MQALRFSGNISVQLESEASAAQTFGNNYLADTGGRGKLSCSLSQHFNSSSNPQVCCCEAFLHVPSASVKALVGFL